VIRGGSWNNDASNCRSANRNNNPPDNRNNDVGFRLSSSRQPSDGVRSRTHPLHPRPDPRPGPVPARVQQYHLRLGMAVHDAGFGVVIFRCTAPLLFRGCHGLSEACPCCARAEENTGKQSVARATQVPSVPLPYETGF